MSRRPRLKRVLALVLGLGVAFLAVEVALRVWFVSDGMFLGRRPLPPFGAITTPDQRARVEAWRERRTSGSAASGYGEFRSDLGWAPRASATSHDGRYRSNAIGARGSREYAPKPPEGMHRIACFGDSFTFCDGVDDGEAWPAQIESQGPRYEAMNFGVAAYGTDQAFLRFRSLRGTLHADTVLIGIMLENIGRNVNRYRPLYYPRTGSAVAKPRFRLDARGSLVVVPLPYADADAFLDGVVDGSVIGDLREHEYWSTEDFFGSSLVSLRLAAGYFAYRARQHRRLWLAQDAEPFRVTLAILEQFHREALADGARAAPVLIFPAESDFETLASDGERYWSVLTEELGRRGVPHVDLSLPLERASRERPGARTTWFKGGHLCAEANAIVAHAVRAWIEKAPNLRPGGAPTADPPGKR